MSVEQVIDHDFTARKAEASVRLRKMQGAEVSEAHSFTHLDNVAGLTQVVGALYDFSPRELQLALIPGYMHDLIRSSTEDHDSVNDEEASADRVDGMLKRERERQKIDISDEEIEAIHYAIANHSQAPKSFLDPQTRNLAPESLSEKLHIAVFVADKLEANGARVIARRSSFVAGDRLSKDGDWQNFGFRPKDDGYEGDELLVVALESMIRMGFKNPKDIYPDNLKPLVDPLYKIQEEFFLGVCKAADVTVEDLARLLVHVVNENGRSIIESSGVKGNSMDAGRVAATFKERSGLNSESILLIDDDIVDSSREAVGYFSSQYKKDLDELSGSWDPTFGAAKSWHKGMVDYATGDWVKGIREEFGLI